MKIENERANWKGEEVAQEFFDLLTAHYLGELTGFDGTEYYHMDIFQHAGSYVTLSVMRQRWAVDRPISALKKELEQIEAN